MKTRFLTVFMIFVGCVFSCISSIHAQSNNTDCTLSENGVDFIETLNKCAAGTQGVKIDAIKSDGKSWLELGLKSFASAMMRYGALFSVMAIVIAGILYVTAAGSDEKIARGKKIMIYAVVWLFLTLISFSLVNAVIVIIYGFKP